MMSSASTAPPSVSDGAQIGMLGEYRRARDRRGHDQRIAGRLVLHADRIAVRGRVSCLSNGAAISVPSFSITRTHGLRCRLAGRAVGQEHVRRNVRDELQRLIAGAMPA